MDHRVLPNDCEAEERVLANLFCVPEDRGEILQNLNSSDFYLERHRLVFEAIKGLGEKFDAGAVCRVLKERHNGTGTEGVGWGSIISGLMDESPGSIDLSGDIQKVLDTAARREFITGLRQLEGKTHAGELPVDEAIESLARIGRRQLELAPPITPEEFISAKLAPACVVRDYLYADVANLTAPGGTGKTTIMLREMAHIVLGRQLYGLDVKRSGRCVYVTAEDSREVLVARLREIAVAMMLDDEECQAILNKILIWDVAGEGEKLIRLRDGNAELTPLADKIVSAYRANPPVLIVFDPAVSFGASEGMVNDNEQGLITAARRIVRRLGCCVRFISHTGKANAREKTLDQYTSRGGSALADGTRMTAVMQPWRPGDVRKLPPGLAACSPDSSVTILARPKLSFSRPNLPLIWIKRTGWVFEHVTEIPVSDDERERALLDQVERFIHSEVKAGHYHSKRSVEESMMKFNLSRSAVRSAVERLIAHGRVVMADLPKGKRQGNFKAYLSTAELADIGKLPGELGKNLKEITE